MDTRSDSKPSPDVLKNALFVLDSSSYIFRAYYAIQNGLKAPDGTPTHATFGFLQMLQSLKARFPSQNWTLVWDSKSKNFRHKIFDLYKANRATPPEDLSIQIENSKRGAELLGFHQLEAPGFEADDIIATLVHRFSDRPMVVVTGDKDLLQLVGPRVWCLDTLKEQWSNVPEAHEKFGVEPARIREVQALCGDSVDNIPGAPGIGPKTASQLIQHFGTLEAVLTEAQKRWAVAKGAAKPPKWDDVLKGSKLEAIATHIPQVRMSLELVSLSLDAPIPDERELFSGQHPKYDELQEWARHLGLTKVVQNVKPSSSSTSAEPSVAPAVSSMAPEAWDFEVLREMPRIREVFAELAARKLVCFDTETTSLSRYDAGTLVAVSFSDHLGKGYYLPLMAGDLILSEAEQLERLAVIRNYFAALKDNQELVFQNAKFDLHIFKSNGIEIPSLVRIHDTMVASFVIDPGQKHGMDALAEKYLEGYNPITFEQVLGELEHFGQIPLESAAKYSAEDAVITLRLWNRLKTELDQKSLWKVYDEMDRPLVRVLFEMERLGIRLLPDVLQKLSGELKKDLAVAHEKAMNSLRASGLEIAEDLNLNSSKQVAQILFEQLKLPVLKKGKTGPSTDVSVLEELAEQHEFPKILLEIREISKLLSTYVDAFPELIEKSTGRLHTDFSQIIAQTGRLSSSNPNLQNIPIRTERGRKIRDAFGVKDGCVLVGADYSQIELRVLALMSGDAELRRAFKDGADIHKRTASLVLGKNESEITDDDRRIAKTINFGIIYGQTAFGLAKQLGIARFEAQKFIDAYFERYPGIRTYMDQAIELAKSQNLSRTLTGRIRPIPDISSKNPMVRNFAERVAINSPVQGTAADLMKIAMIRLRDRLVSDGLKARIVLQIHDELLVEAPAEESTQVQALMKEVMEDRSLLSSFGINELDVFMKVDCGVGATWGDT